MRTIVTGQMQTESILIVSSQPVAAKFWGDRIRVKPAELFTNLIHIKSVCYHNNWKSISLRIVLKISGANPMGQLRVKIRSKWCFFYQPRLVRYRDRVQKMTILNPDEICLFTSKISLVFLRLSFHCLGSWYAIKNHIGRLSNLLNKLFF